MTVNILLTFYAIIALWFMQSVSVSRMVRNVVAIILGVTIGDLWAN